MVNISLSRKQKFVNIFAAAGIIVAFILKIYMSAATFHRPHIWSITPGYPVIFYFLDYSHGFIPRALIGEIFTGFFLERFSVESIFFFIFWLFFSVIILSVITAVLMIFKEKNAEKRAWLWMILIWAYFNPSTYLFIASDFGRLDLFIIILTFFFGVLRYYSEKCVCLLPLFAAIITAIHDAAVFLYLPLLLFIAFLTYDFSDIRKLNKCLLITLLTIISSITVVVAGKINFDNDIYLEIIRNNITHNNLSKYWEVVDTVKDYSAHSYIKHVTLLLSGKGFIPLQYIRMILSLFFYAFSYIFIWKIWIKLYFSFGSPEKRMLPVITAILSLIPLLLCFVGCDYGRWFAAFTYSQYVIFFIMIPRCSRFKISKIDIIFFFTGIIIFNASGPASPVVANSLVEAISLNLLKCIKLFVQMS